ncbi:DUF302 domain-containing protein [Gelidibacter salicanalis]|uniref:DUF302 domain-containing protein n=1 Tax=Gelidibacter salicanalis TaxID=291193 RepID=A0A5C7AFP4_9FLAO|nr:DUF302 domain-containing protein [Gelidibacter salicanalis]TXE07368.1 DUF302 domain-containing protein [Gelidibacter salicanalis]
MTRLSLLFAFSLLLNSCNDDPPKLNEENAVEPPNVSGVVYYKTDSKLDVAYANLKAALTKNENIGIVQEIDHAKNAVSVQMELPPTKVILFGNPKLGTPLMQKNQLAGLDLPLKVLFYEDRGSVFALYNSTPYLASRYDIGKVESLSQISDALQNLVGTAMDAHPVQSSDQDVGLHKGVVSVKSSNDFETTYTKLKSSLEANGNLSIMAELDHQKNAQSVSMKLRPTKVIMFGNPKLGTPLMQSSRGIALDLPQKMLVWQGADGTVFISYNNPAFLKARYQLEGNAEQFEQITKALETLSNGAADAN